MTNDRELKTKLKKAGFSSLLELAIHLPQSYLDTRLSSEIRPGAIHTIEAQVISAQMLSNRLAVTVRTPIAPWPIDVTIFHPKPYHQAIFKPGLKHNLHGKIERFGSKLQMVNPQKVSKTGEILPKYRCKLRQDIHRRLVEALVTPANLVGEGLDEKRAELIVRAHRPDGRWLALYQKFGGLGPKTVEALKFAEALDYFKRMRKKRKAFPAMAKLEGDLVPFLKCLPFTLTPGQQKAIKEIRADLASDQAARRMVVGDVGSGKTMVILAAAMTAYPNKAILMAPTSILARQLYEEAKKWLPEQVKKALVTNSQCEGDIQTAHFIIGTHALLYRDLPEAPLVMVDEQHRFGTEQRKMLERLALGSDDYKNNGTGTVSRSHGPTVPRPHYLQFSATPIPRTQAMIDSALVDVSLIEGTPFKKDITTRVIGKKDFSKLLEHIESEIAEGRQVLVVYPLVEESEHIGYRSLEESEDFWKSRFEGVYVTHGKDKNKEEVLQRFAEDGKILLSTTVIEVGISLPKLSTIVIVGAERMGLATLHQLRGRVSRTGLKGYCFLFTHQPKSERLDAFCRTMNGFEIARLDLKFRQSGDLLDGKVQSGMRFRWLDLAEDEEIVAAVKNRLTSLKNLRHSGLDPESRS